MWKKYSKTGVQEMRSYVRGEDMSGISISTGDVLEEGGMVARNSKNYEDQWYVAKVFFNENYEPFEW